MIIAQLILRKALIYKFIFIYISSKQVIFLSIKLLEEIFSRIFLP